MFGRIEVFADFYSCKELSPLESATFHFIHLICKSLSSLSFAFADPKSGVRYNYHIDPDIEIEIPLMDGTTKKYDLQSVVNHTGTTVNSGKNKVVESKTEAKLVLLIS